MRRPILRASVTAALAAGLGLIVASCANLDCGTTIGPGSEAGACRAHTTFFSQRAALPRETAVTKF